MDELMKALGFYRVEERPLQVGDTVEILEDNANCADVRRGEQAKVIKVVGGRITISDPCRLEHVWLFDAEHVGTLIRRVDPPTREADEVDKPEIIELVGGRALWLSESNRIVAELKAFQYNNANGQLYDLLNRVLDYIAELRRQLAEATRERDEFKRDLLRIEKSMESAKAIVAEEHEKRVTAERERDELRKNIDDPELDCTDAAHPAWWRGHDHTAKVFCQLVNEILDGNDVSHGISGEPWQATKMRVADLRTKLATAEADEESAIAERDENEAAMQWLDTQTGGDGEFYFSTDGNDTSTVRNMAEKIAERFSKLEADAAAMLRIMTENESRLNDVIRRIGVSTTTGWITHELNHVLLDIPSGTASRELLDRHNHELAAKDAEIERLKRNVANENETWKESYDEIKDLENELDSLRLDYVSYRQLEEWSSSKPVKRVHDAFVMNSPTSIVAATIEHLRDSRKRYLRKCRTAKAALVEAYRGKIDGAWFGEKSELYKYRTTANPSGVIWRTSDGQSCEAAMVGHSWITATAYSSWQECCADKRTYPCHADRTPLAVEMPTMEEIEELIDGPCKAWRDDKSFDDERDAALLRKLRELLRNSGIVPYRNTDTCVDDHDGSIRRLLIAIRDGGAK